MGRRGQVRGPECVAETWRGRSATMRSPRPSAPVSSSQRTSAWPPFSWGRMYGTDWSVTVDRRAAHQPAAPTVRVGLVRAGPEPLDAPARAPPRGPCRPGAGRSARPASRRARRRRSRRRAGAERLLVSDRDPRGAVVRRRRRSRAARSIATSRRSSRSRPGASQPRRRCRRYRSLSVGARHSASVGGAASSRGRAGRRRRRRRRASGFRRRSAGRHGRLAGASSGELRRRSRTPPAPRPGSAVV